MDQFLKRLWFLVPDRHAPCAAAAFADRCFCVPASLRFKCLTTELPRSRASKANTASHLEAVVSICNRFLRENTAEAWPRTALPLGPC